MTPTIWGHRPPQAVRQDGRRWTGSSNLVAEPGQVHQPVLGPNGAGKTTCGAHPWPPLLAPRRAGQPSAWPATTRPSPARGRSAPVIGAGRPVRGRRARTMTGCGEPARWSASSSPASRRRAARARSDRVLELLRAHRGRPTGWPDLLGGMRRTARPGRQPGRVAAPACCPGRADHRPGPAQPDRVWGRHRGRWPAAGTDVLLTTQYLDEADHLASRVVIIDHGRVVAAGTPSELKQRAGRNVIEVHDLGPGRPGQGGGRPRPAWTTTSRRSRRPPAGSAWPWPPAADPLRGALGALDAAGVAVEDISAAAAHPGRGLPGP